MHYIYCPKCGSRLNGSEACSGEIKRGFGCMCMGGCMQGGRV